MVDWETEQGRYEMKLSRGAAFQAMCELDDLVAKKNAEPKHWWARLGLTLRSLFNRKEKT